MYFVKNIIFFSILIIFSILYIACNSTTTESIIIEEQSYYVDVEDGNDTNDGKTPQSAWKTLQRVNNHHLKAGNKILFKAGGIWRGKLDIKYSGTLDYPIVIGSYGDGDRPIISAVNTIKIDKWYPYNGRGEDGIDEKFKEPVNNPDRVWIALILDNHPDRVKVDGREILGAFDSMELGEDFRWSYNRDKSGILFYYYGDKPDTIETNLDSAAIHIYGVSNIEVKDIEFRGGYIAGIFIEESSYIAIQDVVVGDMSKQGVYVKAKRGVSKGIIIDRSTIDSKYTLDYKMAETDLSRNGRTTTTRGASEGIIFLGNVQESNISNSTIKNWTHANINFFSTNKEELSYNLIYNNLITSPDIAYGGRIGIDGWGTHNNKFYDNNITDIASAIQFNGKSNSFYNNRVVGTRNSPLKSRPSGYGLVLQGYASSVENNIIKDNLFKDIAADGIKISGNNQAGAVKNNEITGNRFENSGQEIVIDSLLDGSYANSPNTLSSNSFN